MNGRPSIPAEVPVEQIVVGENVRADLEDLSGLEATAARMGILDPVGLAINADDGRYRLVYGFRRFAVALRLGIRTIPAVLVPEGVRAEIINLVENVQRKALTPLEEADGFRQLELHTGSSEEAAAIVGLSGAYVRGRIRLLGTHPDVQRAVQDGTLSPSNATELARLPVVDQPQWLARARRLSVRALRANMDFQLASPEERERLGAAELARQAGHEPQETLPTIPTDVEDPRLLLALEYARRTRDHVLAIQRLWPQMSPGLRVQVREILNDVDRQIVGLWGE